MGLRKLIEFGIYEETDPFQKKTIKAVNLFALIMVVGILMGILNLFVVGNRHPIFFEFCILVFSLCPLYFNHKRWYQLASWTIVFLINLSIYFVNEYYPAETAVFLFYFPLIISVALLYNPSHGLKSIGFYLAFSIVAMLFSLLTDSPLITQITLDKNSSDVLALYDLFIAVTVTMILVVMFVTLIHTQNAELGRLLSVEKSTKQKLVEALHEKEILLSEVHHRVKNNLTIISSLLNLQMGMGVNDETNQILRANRNRVISMGKVHEKLYKNHNFSKINFNEYLIELIAELKDSYIENDHVEIRTDVHTSFLSVTEAIPAGLIINEAITNCLKHAYTGLQNQKSVIQVSLKESDKIVSVLIHDNGKGFPEPISAADSESLGMILMVSLTEQLDGKIEFLNDSGALVRLTFAKE